MKKAEVDYWWTAMGLERGGTTTVRNLFATTPPPWAYFDKLDRKKEVIPNHYIYR